MKAKKPNEMTDEQLLKTGKTLKTILSMLIGALLVLIGAVIFLTIKKGFSALTVVPLGLSPIVLIIINNLKEITEEIKARGLK